MEHCAQIVGALASPSDSWLLPRQVLSSVRHAYPRLEPVVPRRTEDTHPRVRIGVLSFPAPHDPPRVEGDVVQEIDFGNMFSCGTHRAGQLLQEAWAVAALLAVAPESAASSVVVHVGCWLAIPPPCEYYGADDGLLEDDATTVNARAAEQESVIRAIAAGLGHRGAGVRRVVLHATLCAGRLTTEGHITRQVGVVLERCSRVRDVVVVLHVGCAQHGGAAPEVRAEVDNVLNLVARHVAGRRGHEQQDLRYLGLHFVRPGPRDDLRLLGRLDLSHVDRWDLQPLLSALASSEPCPALTVEYHVVGFGRHGRHRYVNRMLPHSKVWLRPPPAGTSADASGGADRAAGAKDTGGAAGAALPAMRDTTAGECAVGCEIEGPAAEAGRRALCSLSARLQSVRLVGVHASEVACLVESAARCNPRGLRVGYGSETGTADFGAVDKCAPVRFCSLRVSPASGVGASAPVAARAMSWPDVLLRAGAASATGVVCDISVLAHLEDRLAGRMLSVTRLTLLAKDCYIFTRDGLRILGKLRHVQHVCLQVELTGAPRWYLKIQDMVQCFPSLTALVLKVGDTHNYPYAPGGKIRDEDASACLCEVAEVIASETLLHSIKVQGVKLTGASLRRVAAALRLNTRLRHLQIDKCFVQVASSDVKELSDALGSNAGSRLQTITLGALFMHTADVAAELARCFLKSHVLWGIRLPRYQQITHLGNARYHSLVTSRVRRMVTDATRERVRLDRDRASWSVVRAQIERAKERAAGRGAVPSHLGLFTLVPLRARRSISSFVAPRATVPYLVFEPFA